MSYDFESPPGSWRAEQHPGASCAVCKQSVCDHCDTEYFGAMPPRQGGSREGERGLSQTLSTSQPGFNENPSFHAAGDTCA